jgi:glutaminase
MINVGAVTTHSLVGDPAWSLAERDERVRAGLSAFAGRPLEIDEAVFASERSTADRNMALAYMVRAQRRLEDEPRDAVDGYTRQCSLLVTSRETNSLDDFFVIHASIISRPAQHDLIINLAFLYS